MGLYWKMEGKERTTVSPSHLSDIIVTPRTTLLRVRPLYGGS